MSASSNLFHHELSHENLRFLSDSPFVVCAFFTSANAALEKYAERLSRSCDKYDIPYSVYKVPMVHRSISENGSDDLEFTKANFIRLNLDRFERQDVLYMDIDTFFVDRPDKLFDLRSQRCDLAVYNWLADKHNEAYVPVALNNDNVHSELFAFSHSIEFYSIEQLLCSGGVQYYGNTSRARFLLNRWQVVVAKNACSADDKSLDYAFNNYIFGKLTFNHIWLDKAYLRMAWWPHVKPVILHPGFPTRRSQSPTDNVVETRRFYPELCQRRDWEPWFARDRLIDTKSRVLVKIEKGKVIQSTPIEASFWVYPDEIEYI